MYSIQQIINRYKDIVKTGYSVMGYLSFGAHEFYKKNSDESLNINSNYEGFITNENGEVELFKYNEDYEIPLEPYFRDQEFTIPVTQEEIYCENLDYDYTYFRDFKTEEKNSVFKWYDDTIDKYYLHPYYPKKEIKAFEVIRILPGCFVGNVYNIRTINDIPYIFANDLNFTVKYCLQYPEFFKPLYI